ncbi:MAG: ABC transporter ATP-binding protein [Chloroflexi bacterium]|nr:ABC transporter ATP-binding protein [Chloroflexota bacterium]
MALSSPTTRQTGYAPTKRSSAPTWGTSDLLELRAVVAGYGRSTVLHGLDMTVRAGEIVGLLGANGAGKTTTLRVVSGVLPLRSGSILFEGRTLAKHGPHLAIRMGIAHCPEGRRIFPALTVRENLELGGAVLKRSVEREAAISEVLDLFPVLAERQGQAGGTLSGGEQQMLAIGRALVARPRLLMLDEPSLGLAPLIVRQVADLVRRLRETGVTILLVEQNAALALSLADRAYILESGVVALSGESATLAADPAVRAAYLGSGTFVRRRGRPAVPEPQR